MSRQLPTRSGPNASEGRRPMSTFRPLTGKAPFTQGRPVTGIGSSGISVPPRTGLAGGGGGGVGGLAPATTARGRSAWRRQVQDKSYFLALLREKIHEITNEMSALSRERDKMAAIEASAGHSHRKAEAAARELSELAHELAVYNEYGERARLADPPSELRDEIDSLAADNDDLTSALERVYAERKAREAAIDATEQDMARLKAQWTALKKQFAPADQEKYEILERDNGELNGQCDRFESQISDLRARRAALESRVRSSGDTLTRHEILATLARLRDGEKERDDLLAYASVASSTDRSVSSSEPTGTSGAGSRRASLAEATSSDEKTRLMAQAKRDSREIASLESRRTGLQTSSDELAAELAAYADERSVGKFRDLHAKEVTMKSFLADYRESSATERRRYDSLTGDINSRVERGARALAHLAMLGDGFQRDSTSGGGAADLKTLLDEERKMDLDLNKIDQLEGKINSELDQLRAQIAELERELVRYADVPKLKAELEERIRAITAQKDSLTGGREAAAAAAADATRSLNAFRDEVMAKSESYRRAAAAETELGDLITANTALRDTVAAQTSSALRCSVLDEIKRYNQKLIGY